MGNKTPKDISICLKTLQNITKEQWTSMCQLEGNVVETEKVVARDSRRSESCSFKIL
jgi:hypothetical protein